MVRFSKSLWLGVVFLATTFSSTYTYAQSTPTSPTASPLSTATPTKAVATATPRSGVAAQITATVATPNAVQLIPTATPAAAVSNTATTSPTLSAPVTATSATQFEAVPLEGTILANRSDVVARFFLEGETYQLVAGRSQGFNLPRSTTVLNLFNCAGDIDVNTAGCYWDPYLIHQDGFYEIYNAPTSVTTVQLMLREAGTPPTGQVWVQNRTGQTESVVFKEDVYEIPPTVVQEFPVASGVPAILYVRSCLTVDSHSACEWAPKALDAGVYYAMVEVDTPGSQSGATLTNIDLRPVVGDEVEGAGVAEVAASQSIICSVVVPALNVRSGPGLQYDIIGKVRTTDGSAGTVMVNGRSADNEWLTVDPSVASGGWINNSPSFITCASDIMVLPLVDAPAVPTPQPGVAQEIPATVDPAIAPVVAETPAVEANVPQETPATGSETAESTGDAAPAIPDGQAVLVINNGFQYEIRFTLDQVFRVVEGPSEYDLQPGQSLSLVVYPGDIAFTASSPWSGLSGNASIRVEANQSLSLWLRFEPEGGDNWVFRWN